MALRATVVGILVFAAVMTVWTLGFQPLYEVWVLEQGGTIGIGEVYLGFVVPALASSILTYILCRKLSMRETS